MRAKDYYGDRPCVEYIWVLLDKLGTLTPKLRPAVKPPKQHTK